MKFWKLASAAAALVLSTSANAIIISYGGYTHDTDTDIVTGNGLEWLQWDRTLGEGYNSIQSQLDTLEGGGWSVASNVQMAQLFNAFDFGIMFDTDETTPQSVSTGRSTGDPGTEADEVFISFFGDINAHLQPNGCRLGDCQSRTSAIFGNDTNSNGYVNHAIVADDYINDTDILPETRDGFARMDGDTNIIYTTDEASIVNGVALVREVSAVPVPAAVWLFGSGLLGLIGVARRKKS